MFLTPEPDALIDILPIMINMGYGRDVYHAIGTCKTLWEDKYIWQVVKDMRFGELLQTPLMHHAYDGPTKHEIIKSLLSRKASLKTKDADGSTALFYASNGNQPETVKFLHSLGADINEPDDEGATPLIDSANLGNLEALEALLELGANKTTWDKKFGCSPFLSAARGYGHPGEQDKCMKLLLKHGADVNERSFDGKTALIYLSKYNWSSADLDYLIGLGANLNLTDYEGETALHMAVKQNNLCCALTLLAAGANPNIGCSIGMTPLHWAALNCYEVMVDALLSSHADPLATTDRMVTPMDLLREELENEETSREEVLEYRRIAKTLYENGDEDAYLPPEPLELLWLAEMETIQVEEDPMWLLKAARLDRIQPLEYGWALINSRQVHSRKMYSLVNYLKANSWYSKYDVSVVISHLPAAH
jgi:ankyrin repeat protein